VIQKHAIRGQESGNFPEVGPQAAAMLKDCGPELTLERVQALTLLAQAEMKNKRAAEAEQAAAEALVWANRDLEPWYSLRGTLLSVQGDLFGALGRKKEARESRLEAAAPILKAAADRRLNSRPTAPFPAKARGAGISTGGAGAALRRHRCALRSDPRGWNLASAGGSPVDIVRFLESARRAVSQWRWRPGRKDGQPVDMGATVEVNFKLSRLKILPREPI
jgi:TonB-like protein